MANLYDKLGLSTNSFFATGFIFSDGTILPSHLGHAKAAFEFIRDNNLENLYQKVLKDKKIRIYSEEDFIIIYLGAVKLYHYGGNHYLYCSLSTYQDKEMRLIIRKYKEMGYIVIKSDFEFEVSSNDKLPKCYNLDYTSTIIKANGRYYYNPLRIGD